MQTVDKHQQFHHLLPHHPFGIIRKTLPPSSFVKNLLLLLVHYTSIYIGTLTCPHHTTVEKTLSQVLIGKRTNEYILCTSFESQNFDSLRSARLLVPNEIQKLRSVQSSCRMGENSIHFSLISHLRRQFEPRTVVGTIKLSKCILIELSRPRLLLCGREISPVIVICCFSDYNVNVHTNPSQRKYHVKCVIIPFCDQYRLFFTFFSPSSTITPTS